MADNWILELANKLNYKNGELQRLAHSSTSATDIREDVIKLIKEGVLAQKINLLNVCSIILKCNKPKLNRRVFHSSSPCKGTQ